MIYYDSIGPKHTAATIAAAIKTAKEQGITHMVVATTTGRTTEALLNQGFAVTAVTHQAGYGIGGKQELSEEMRTKLIEGGANIFTGTHFFAGADRALNRKFGGVYPGELMAHTLRIMGQGFKVCVEIAVMALDGGCIPFGEEVIAIGGSGKGADTAVILTPAHSQDFFETEIKEIICMPRGRKHE